MTPDTQIYTVAYKYRFVVSIDVTPSMAAIDPVTGEVLFDQVIATVEKCLIALTENPVSFPALTSQVPRILLYINGD